MSLVAEVLAWVATTPVYSVLLPFVAAYPLFTGVMWTLTSLIFYVRNEREVPPADAAMAPVFVSVVVAAYDEEAVIESTLEALLAMDYPAFEIVVVDDGSKDATAALLRPYATAGQIRLIEKRVNEGKAMALNDAIPVTRGEIVTIVDADIRPSRDTLRHLVGHFAHGRVAAVAGNPQVANTESLLAKIQATEFASIVSVLRRAQRVWGRILTVSGAVCAFRRSAMVDVGLFDPDMATEDIALTWKLQRRFYDVRYEPRAVVAMQVPETLGGLWRQRKRWATGLAQVLKRNAPMFLDWRTRRLWPVFAEAVLSVVWAFAAVSMFAFWALSYLVGLEPLGANPLPNLWGLVIATIALLQLGVGLWLDRHYNRSVGRFYLWAAMYPLFYWALMLVVTVTATPAALLRRRGRTSHWKTERIRVAPSSAGSAAVGFVATTGEARVLAPAGPLRAAVASDGASPPAAPAPPR
jgi:biofilm PGA synthesis N-glycosyltransferase PgaC